LNIAIAKEFVFLYCIAIHGIAARLESLMFAKKKYRGAFYKIL